MSQQSSFSLAYHHPRQQRSSTAATAATLATSTRPASSRTQHDDDGLGRSSPTILRILSPNPNDILLGRGRPYQHHQGNEAMRDLVEEYKDTYNSLPRSQRGMIINKLVRKVQNSGARFLKKKKTKKKKSSLALARILAKKVQQEEAPALEGEEVWEYATDAEAYEKMAHALRSKVGRANSCSFLSSRTTNSSGSTTSTDQAPRGGGRTTTQQNTAPLNDDATSPQTGVRDSLSGVLLVSRRCDSELRDQNTKAAVGGGSTPSSSFLPLPTIMRQERQINTNYSTRRSAPSSAEASRATVDVSAGMTSSSFTDIAIRMAIQAYLYDDDHPQQDKYQEQGNYH